MNISNKVGRNDFCLCGSGDKYKHCCLSNGGFKTETMNDQITDKNFYDALLDGFNTKTEQVVIKNFNASDKLSSNLLDICAHLLNEIKTKHERKAIITLACVAWNIAIIGMFESQSTEQLLDEFFDLSDDPQEIKEIIKNIINSFIEVKLSFYPDDNRVITDFEIQYIKKELSLIVMGTEYQKAS